jgi:putative ABC transport system permease protein
LIKDDGSEGETVNFMAAPNGSKLIEPMMIAGRWLDPRDENAIVLADQFQRLYPNLKVGDTLQLMINGKKRDFVVVGFCQIAGKLGGLIAYGNLDYFNSLPGQKQNQAMIYRVVAKEKMTAAQQKDLSTVVQDLLEKNKYQIGSISTGSRINQMSSDGFNILTTVLLVLAILIALVGSIGLTGTMSMNIMDRTREIGIMRSIGASDSVLFRMVLIEGLLIGWISWGIGALLSFPISILLSNGINTALFGATSSFGFSITGFLIWFAVVSLLSILSSITPARSATRLTIREVLAYE